MTAATADALFAPASPGDVAALSAPQVTEMLRRHYLPENRPPAGVFAAEIEAPDGTRRCDVLWMPTSRASGYALHGHEIKVSRSDLLVELGDPAKPEPWMQYCTYWWLVVSRPDLVNGLDIPAEWGIMAPPSGRRKRSMTVLRPAPKLNPRNPAPGLGRLLTWQRANTDSRIISLDQELAFARRELEWARLENGKLRASGARITKGGEVAAELVDRLTRAAADERLWLDIEDDLDGVVAAILARQATLAAQRRTVQCIEATIRQVNQAMAPFSGLRDQLDRARRLLAAAGAEPADETEADARALLADQLGAVPITT